VRSKSIGLIYLGTLGAGSKITLTLAEQLKESGIEVRLVLSSHNQDLIRFMDLGVNISIVELPALKPFLLIPFAGSRLRSISEFVKNCGLVYFPMPHPRDNQIVRKLLRQNVLVGRGIHDFSRHPGDFWPNKFSIKSQVSLSTFLVTHSNFVKSKVHSSKAIVFPLPRPSLYLRYKPQKGCVVFVGRLVKYKGLDLLIKSWDDVVKVHSYAFLQISGRGRVKFKNLKSSISLDRRWLQENEISDLIAKASCVVFPYVEASQSGMIPSLVSLKIPLVVTNVGGLAENVDPNTAIIVRPTSSDISTAIATSISNWSELDEVRIDPGNHQLCDYLLNYEG
jgi:glycosyltransferase involved in cell wall biosynthesis